MAHKTVADPLGFSPLAVANHLDLLEQANLVYQLPPLDVGGKRCSRPGTSTTRRRRPPERRPSPRRGGADLFGRDGDDRGDTVLRHLFAYYYRDTPTIAYWRDIKTDKEIDIIVKSPQYELPFEVKYRETAEIESSSGLVELCRREPVKQADLVTKREQDFGPQEVADVDARFMRVPAHVLCYLLGQAERLLWM